MAEKLSDNSPSEAPSRSRADSVKSEERSSHNWWDSWITSAKSKSAEVYCMVKKDLDEIGSAVKSEATHVFNSTSTAIGKTLKLDDEESTANVMKKSLTTFIGQVSTVLNPEPDDEEDTEVILSSGDTTMLSTYKKELESLQRVDATFIVPADSPEFTAWRASAQEGEVLGLRACARRLNASPVLKTQYEKLVPDAVSREDFWERYMFRVGVLQDRLSAAARSVPADVTDPVLANLPLSAAPLPVMQSPKKTITPEDLEPTDNDTSASGSVTWEHEDFAHDIELTEEQQILLLEEYEKEIAGKQMKPTKQTSTRDISNNNTKSQSTNTKAANKKTQQKPTVDKKKAIEPSNTKRQVQTRDKLNNKTAIDKKNKNVKVTAKKGGKSDVCGNNMVEDYFGDKDAQKDDASSHSDESWEKEFEIEEAKLKA